MKKLGCILLTALLTLSLCFSNSYAVEVRTFKGAETQLFASNKSEVNLLFELEELVKENILKGNYSINISDMNIKAADYPGVSDLIKFSPYLGNDFQIGFSIYTSGSQSGCYAYINIKDKKGGKNYITTEELKKYFAKVDAKIAEIKGMVTNDMSDYQKALVIHDYLCISGEYDQERLSSGSMPFSSYTSAGILMNNIGVCDSYAHAYQYIMNLLGIDCYVTSTQTHAWNIIKIDGKYYHVDVTWDDPVQDRLGLLLHKYFLVSDTTITDDKDHNDWNLKQTYNCPDDYSDESILKDNNSPVVIYGLDTYYINNRKLMKKNSNGTTEVANLGVWDIAGSSSIYPRSYSGLFIKDGELYFNTAKEIKKYSLISGNISSVYSLSADELSKGRIYGIRLNEEKIQYKLANSPNNDQDIGVYTIQIQIESISFEKDEYKIDQHSTLTLLPVIVPENATERTLTWTSSNPAIATVDENGTVTAKEAGTTTITVTTSNGKTATCEVTVVVPVEKVELNKKDLTLNKGANDTLIATITPEDASEKTLTWTSSDESVATVDENGKVTAIGVGTATITVSCNGKTATCKVTVVIPVEKVELNKNSLTLNVGNEEALIATITPENATDKTLTWTSSNEKVATVDNNGKVIAIGVGTTTITVSCNGQTATCKVEVKSPIISVSLNETSKTLNKGSSFILEATIDPINTTDDKTLTWTSSNESVATVKDGTVTAIGAGNATITVTTSNGKTATCEVKVVDIKELVLDVKNLTLDLSVDSNKTGQLNAEIIYNQLTRNIADNSIAFPMTWKSSDTSIATVDENGLVTAKGIGKAMITVSILDGEYKATCEVTVNKSISKIEFVDIKNNQLNMVDTETKTIKLSITPGDSNEKYTWESSDKEVATVEQDGKITALKAGETTITVKTNSGKSFSFKLVVSDHVHIAGDWEVVKNSTCTEEGQKVRKCTICKEVIETKTIDKKPHTFGEWKVIKVPTIKDEGKEIRKCSSCGMEEERTIAKIVHEDKDHKFNGKEVVIKEATCTEEGIKRIYCSIDLCEAYKEVKIPKKDHTLKDWEMTIKPTCDKDGEQVQKCKVCNHIINTETIPATGHQWKDWEVVKEATCTQEGLEKRVCSVCGKEEANKIAKVKHTLGEWEVTKEATCTETGEKVQKCKVCGDVINTETIPAAGHQWKDWGVVTEATCTEEGLEKRVCSVCGKEETRVIAKEEHTLGEWEVTKEATCTENGEQIQKCVVCGNIIKTEEILAQHHFGEWEIIKEATETQQGLKERICEVCGEKEEEIIPIKVIVDENENKDDKVVVDDKKDQSDSKKNNVKTNDNTNIGLYGIMIGLSVLSIIALYRKKESNS